MGRHRQYDNDTERQRAHRLKQRLQRQSQTPCVRIGNLVTLYCGDALQIAPTLQQAIHAVIADPPYGTNYDFTKARRSRNPLQPAAHAAPWTANVRGDAQPFDPAPWLQYNQLILWGADHYRGRLPAPQGYITWEKRCGSTPDDHPGCELAWSNIPGSSRVHWQKWRGIIREGEDNVANGPKLHSAQKPIELLDLCVSLTTGTVLDPYMGSGTTGLACLRAARTFIGIELDPHYFTVAWQRLQDACQHLQAAAAQGALFPVLG